MLPICIANQELAYLPEIEKNALFCLFFAEKKLLSRQTAPVFAGSRFLHSE